MTRKLVFVQMKIADVKFPVWLRVPSSDVPAFNQVLVRKEYAFDVRRTPRIIVDAGANIGLASIYFANRFPDSKILAIEPERSNFDLLERNTAPYGNITPLCAALWRENALVNLVDPGLGKWGFRTEAQDEVGTSHEICHQVPGMTVDTIMKEHGIEHIDILKVDIEGAEREVFSDTSSWLGKVDALIIELHERLKEGCNRSFYNGSNGFDDEWVQGDNVYLARTGGCLVAPSRRAGAVDAELSA